MEGPRGWQTKQLSNEAKNKLKKSNLTFTTKYNNNCVFARCLHFYDAIKYEGVIRI